MNYHAHLAASEGVAVSRPPADRHFPQNKNGGVELRLSPYSKFNIFFSRRRVAFADAFTIALSGYVVAVELLVTSQHIRAVPPYSVSKAGHITTMF